MNYFVYIRDLLALETNLPSFPWSYGICAPPSDKQAFEMCKIRLRLELVSDQEVFPNGSIPKEARSFGPFSAIPEENTVFYEKHLAFSRFLRFWVCIRGESVTVRVGKTYFNSVRMRIMNLYALRYVLFDLVSGLLLLHGYATLYASAVAFPKTGKSALCFAAPGTGKTLSALLLCREHGADFLSEDIVLTDGSTLFSVPYTASFRSDAVNAGRRPGRLGSLFTEVFRSRKKNSLRELIPSAELLPQANATDLFVLEKGEEKICENSEKALHKLCLLNRYLLHYHRSPCVLALSYFNPAFSPEVMAEREKEILRTLLQNTSFRCISSPDPFRFAELIRQALF